MAIEGEVLFRERQEILDTFLADMQAAVPDFYIGDDGNAFLLFQVVAGVIESVFLGVQLLSEDMFVQTANESALSRHAEMYGVDRGVGENAVGELLFTAAGGTFIDIGAEAVYDSGTGVEPVFFATTEAGTVPNPGIPTAPTLANQAAGLLVAGLYEYVITFVTAEGETLPGTESAPLNLPASRQIRLTVIPLGGTGTTKRRIYRQRDGGDFKFVAEINDNTTVQYDDNIAEGSLGGLPPTVNTATRIRLDAQAEEPGVAGNVAPNTITTTSDVPDGVTAVSNPAAFTGGTDQEDAEEFRSKIQQKMQNPGTGSPADIKQWAEEVDGVETATVFNNDNLGTPQDGHVTVRIAGPNGAIPDSDAQAAVAARIEAEMLAGIVIHIATFTPLLTDVTVDATPEAPLTLAEITPTVQDAIRDYINSLEVGETLRVAGLFDAVFGLPGVLDVALTTPTTNQATGATEKRVPDDIVVT